MNKKTLEYRLALLYAPGIGPLVYDRITDAFPCLSELFELPKSELAKLGLKETLIEYLHKPNWQAVERDLNWQERPEHHLIFKTDEAYPAQLREIHSAPPILYVRGQLDILQKPQLAIVGTRHPTALGSDIAYQFAEHLAGCGLTITSGLALGIDGISHNGALAVKGMTIAVLGSGLEKLYPSRHRALAEKIIAQGGALVSEFPPDTAARAENFPRRNRIISGLSVGVLIVEAALQSGSLITARYALEQGREIFAIPGSIHNPLAKGCHALIKQGAKLVEKSTDIIEELSAVCPFLMQTAETNRHVPLDLTTLDTHYRKLVECIEFVSTPMDVIIHRSGLTAEAASSMVLMLELQGYVQSVNGGYARL